MKETEEEREATLAYNNPWLLNYARKHNKKTQTKTAQKQTNKQKSPTQTG